MTEPCTERNVVVVGAGVAGAAAAHRLRTVDPDLVVTVLEGSAGIGGKLATAEVAGVTTDVGAEAVLRRRPEGVDLARASGLGEDLVSPATLSASLWSRGELVSMPRSLMGVPGDLGVLRGLVSEAGLVVARRDSELPEVRLAADEDVSVGDLVAERLGEEVVERLVEPMLGGVYAGHSHALSARAAVPGLVRMLDGTRSLTQAAADAMHPVSPAAADPVFAGIRGGVGRLPAAALAASGATVLTDSMVRRVRRTSSGWELEVGPTRSPRILLCDAVVLATPATATARLLVDVAPGAADELAGIEYASMAVVTLAFRSAGLPVMAGSGFLVPPVDGHAVKGATYSFAKWPWVAEAGGEIRLLRCSIGRLHEERVLQVSDEDLVRLALDDLSAAIGPLGAPVDTHVQRWGGGLPQYAVGHLARVARIRSALSGAPGLEVCGAAYDGVGIPACIASAHTAADNVLAYLGRVPGDAV